MERTTVFGIEKPFPWLLLCGVAAGLLIPPVLGFLAIAHFDCCDCLGSDSYPHA